MTIVYDIRWLLEQSPEGRNDGTGGVNHTVSRQSRPEGESDPDAWVRVLGRINKTVVIPDSVVQTCLAAGTNAQIVEAYKVAFDSYVEASAPTPVLGYDAETCNIVLNANTEATAAATATDTFITVDLDKTYPVGFSL